MEALSSQLPQSDRAVSVEYNRPLSAKGRRSGAIAYGVRQRQLKGNIRFSGYANTELPIEEVVPVELAEVTMGATPAELRRMAEFLLFCASEMDRMGPVYDHIHLGDRMKEFEMSPHFVICRSDR